MTTKKKVKSIEENIDKEKIITEVIKPTDDDIILGVKPEIKTVKVVDYTATSRLYKVTNVKKNRVYKLNGMQIGAILGMNNEARRELKEGAKKVSIKAYQDKKYVELYKIEVIN